MRDDETGINELKQGTLANVRYAHALYDLAERIAAEHPRAAQQLERAADQLVQSLGEGRAD